MPGDIDPLAMLENRVGRVDEKMNRLGDKVASLSEWKSRCEGEEAVKNRLVQFVGWLIALAVGSVGTIIIQRFL